MISKKQKEKYCQMCLCFRCKNNLSCRKESCASCGSNDGFNVVNCPFEIFYRELKKNVNPSADDAIKLAVDKL